jgi:hypothetical protein
MSDRGKVVYWKRSSSAGTSTLLRQIEQARDRVLARINGPAKVGSMPKGYNSFSNPYRPNFLGDCCFKGQNTGPGVRVEAVRGLTLMVSAPPRLRASYKQVQSRAVAV